jgi:hypothetical protein
MLNNEVITPPSSPWSSPVVLVRQKVGTTRFYVDYRLLNAVTTNDANPLPRIDDSFDHLSVSCWFSTLDLCSGCWQVKCEGSDRHNTAFATRSGLYEFRVMPFGLKGVPPTFERLMETVLEGLQWDIRLIYLDDVIVLGRSFEDMVTHLKKVYDRLLAAGLKCHLFCQNVVYLGHVISEAGIATDPEKT